MGPQYDSPAMVSLVSYENRPTILYEDDTPSYLRGYYGMGLACMFLLLASGVFQIVEHTHCVLNDNPHGTLGFMVVSVLGLFVAIVGLVFCGLGLGGYVSWHRKVDRDPQTDVLPWLGSSKDPPHDVLEEAQDLTDQSLPLAQYI